MTFVLSSEAARARAKRRARNAQSEPQEVQRVVAGWPPSLAVDSPGRRGDFTPATSPVTTRSERMALLRADLVAFADGTDSLHGFPRHLVDWPALWSYCERNEQ